MAFPSAERIAAALSFSVSHWRDDGQVLAPPGVPVRLRFLHSFIDPGRFEPVLAALADLLGSPYTTDRWPQSAPIVWVGQEDAADASIHFFERWAHDQRYLAFEARFPHSEAAFQGAFSLD
jgi:hypothetical protein